jgi:hypothetical protein
MSPGWKRFSYSLIYFLWNFVLWVFSFYPSLFSKFSATSGSRPAGWSSTRKPNWWKCRTVVINRVCQHKTHCRNANKYFGIVDLLRLLLLFMVDFLAHFCRKCW